eukprot:482047_1
MKIFFALDKLSSLFRWPSSRPSSARKRKVVTRRSARLRALNDRKRTSNCSQRIKENRERKSREKRRQARERLINDRREISNLPDVEPGYTTPKRSKRKAIMRSESVNQVFNRLQNLTRRQLIELISAAYDRKLNLETDGGRTELIQLIPAEDELKFERASPVGSSPMRARISVDSLDQINEKWDAEDEAVDGMDESKFWRYVDEMVEID